MAVIAVVNAITTAPLVSGNGGLLLSMLLAASAALSLPHIGSWLRARKTVGTAGAVVILLFIAAQIGSRFDFGRMRDPRGIDFSAYYLAGKALGEPGKPLYYLPLYADGRMKLLFSVSGQSYWYRMAARSGISQTMQFNYPPFAAILFEPFTSLPFNAAYLVWTGVTVALLFGSIFLILPMVEINQRLAVLVGAIIGVFSFSPVRSNFYFGQINALVLFLWTAGVYLERKNSVVWSSLCFAVGTMIKVTPFLVVPLFVLTRRWRWLAAYCGWLTVLVALAVARTGWWNLHSYLWQVLPSMSCGAPEFDNRSIAALVQFCYLGWVPIGKEMPEYLPQTLCGVTKAISLGVYLAMAAILYKNCSKRHFADSLVAMALVSLIVSPLSWSHHYVLALLPLLYLWSLAGRLGDAKLRYATAIATILIGTNIALYATALIRHGVIDLVLTAVQPLTSALLVVLHSRFVRSTARVENAC